ncbi:MAG: glycosyltransferase [Acidimicrobiia bacterium]
MALEVVCLLPARNGAADLPGYLASAAHFCDAIVALDDGSTDDSLDVLQGSPLVKVLRTNPPRAGYGGWDDEVNRSRLLRAAGELDPRWILFIDADERIDADDARALREFLKQDALPGCAYGFQHYRMWGRDRYDPDFRWIYRLFAYAPGQTLPNRRLHFNPVPTSIPSSRWVRTTIRVRHFGANDEPSRLARLAKYREADPRLEFGGDDTTLSARPRAPLREWGPRPPGLPVLVGPGDPRLEGLPRQPARVSGAATAPAPARPKLVCLLPARNCEADLPGYFESVARFVDAVVALDDGSTDRTGEILLSNPLVRVLRTNPRRESYRGWDDGANRNRLLRAASEIEPEWVLALDADERISPDDAAALREFVEREAVPGFAYGFRVYRMIDEGHYDRGNLWVYRLFAYERGQSLPDLRMHLVPVPTSIPRSRWLRTTVRIQHLASLTEARRRARFQKYLEADPDGAYQRDYLHLLDPPDGVKPWRPRPEGLPVLVDPRGLGELNDFVLEDLDLDAPILSVVVISQNDEGRIERALRSVIDQECPVPFEVIVVTSGTGRTASIVREKFPQAKVVELPRPALPGEARNAGLRVARGDYVSFPGSHVELTPGSLAARVEAHERGYPMITGVTLNGTRTLSGWASYFLDHSANLPGQASGALAGPPAHCSYARDLLLEVGGFPQDMRAGEDTVVNMELTRRGYIAYRTQRVTLIHHSPCRNPLRLLRHHFTRGRAYGRILREGRRAQGRPGSGGKLPQHILLYVPQRISRTSRSVRASAEEMWRTYRRVLPLVLAAVLAAWAGASYELLRTAVRPWKRGKGGRRPGRPSTSSEPARLARGGTV